VLIRRALSSSCNFNAKDTGALSQEWPKKKVEVSDGTKEGSCEGKSCALRKEKKQTDRELRVWRKWIFPKLTFPMFRGHRNPEPENFPYTYVQVLRTMYFNLFPLSVGNPQNHDRVVTRKPNGNSDHRPYPRGLCCSGILSPEPLVPPKVRNCPDR
jgi:hypothetical protein